MTVKHYILIMVGSIIILSATFVSADTPLLITYQGSLSDSESNPVTNGAYLIQFRLYDNPTGGTELWSSSFRQVEVLNGLFSYNLGDTIPFPASLFSEYSDLWLGIKVGTDSELSPRTKLTSAGYALHALRADTALNVIGNKYVEIAGDEMTGNLQVPELTFGSPGTYNGRLTGYTSFGTFPTFSIGPVVNGHGLSLYSSTTGHYLSAIQPDANTGGGGYFQVNRNSTGDEGFIVDGNYANTQQPVVMILGNDRNVFFNVTSAGNSSVSLPDDAISSLEILDEPGLATNSSYQWQTLPQGDNPMEDICTVEITIPATGYIFLSGNLNGLTGSAIGTNFGRSQIDEIPGGTYDQYHGLYWGVDNYSPPMYHTPSHTRTYYKSAGTYTFRIEAQAYSSNTAGAMTRVRGWLNATYLPTSYGSVISATSNPDEFTDAKSINMEDIDGTVTTTYKVDLRELETRALRARVEAERLELELIKAQQGQTQQTARQIEQ